MTRVPEEIGDACRNDEVATVEQWLEESGRQLDGTDLLFQAAGHGHVAMIRMLISRGATVNYPAVDFFGWTPLMIAASEYKDDAVRLLLDEGADVNARDDAGETALMKAVYGNPEGVLQLLHRGANVDLRDNRGRDAEAIAIQMRRVPQFLLADIRLAGGFKKYMRQPIVHLNVLRVLCERGRATAQSGVLARLFHGPRTSRRRTRRTVGPVVLPRELFACVLSFWRSERALDEDRADDRERFRHRLGF